jgi:basic membrane protein A and related proteins
MKNMDVAVLNAIKAEYDGTFQGGIFVSTLANEGVGLAPFHQLDSLVSAETKAEIEAIKQLIIDGEVQVMP